MKVKIMCGSSGSGKTTYAGKHFPGATVCSADHFFIDGEGNYNFEGSKISEAHAECLKKFNKIVQNTDDVDAVVVVDNTNTTVAEIAPYAALALAYGHELEIIKFVIKSDEIEKIAARNAHGVPDHVVKTQQSRAVGLKLPPWWLVTEVRVAGL